ncbi:YfiR family protein [Brevundimonas sp. 2R-24]|uniref:YfiR family protein n=1 Tax=Peiella sedimenti TaxID=3061083 RepID=A0ABT8SJE2_9CAUL|nr:YfiR family protein [Caulobacteraceae bacterium XZ-24]
MKALALALCLAHSAAVANTHLEQAVKANYLVRFTAFVEWPTAAFPADGSPLHICVAGADPFGQTLDRAAQGQTAWGHPITVRRVGSESLRGCHVAYLGRGYSLTAATNLPVLTVTDADVSGHRGAVHFVVVNSRVRFHIDQGQSQRAGLRISSRLLNLALSVRGAR